MGRIHPLEGLEYAREMLGRYADTRIVYIDAHTHSGAPATDQNTASRLGILDGVTHKVAQDAFEKTTPRVACARNSMPFSCASLSLSLATRQNSGASATGVISILCASS